jgi:hypothetical protein
VSHTKGLQVAGCRGGSSDRPIYVLCFCLVLSVAILAQPCVRVLRSLAAMSGTTRNVVSLDSSSSASDSLSLEDVLAADAAVGATGF